MRGPLNGLRVLEVGGVGPGPFACMMLADMGAEVLRIERPGGRSEFPGSPAVDVLNRGKRSALLDLKRPEVVEAVLTMATRADVLIEGYRPGVAERLGLGPAACLARNPKLVYGRMTGWGQDGPLAQGAGHDIDYIAITGALHAIGQSDGPPQIPLNLLGDFGGGGMYLVVGVLAALRDVDRLGCGQVVDAAIVDGVSNLLAHTHSLLNTGTWSDGRGVNLLDGGAPFYGVYETSDGRHMAVGAIEAKFYAQLLGCLGLAIPREEQHNRETWPQTRALLREAFGRESQAHWIEAFSTWDACVAPVLSLREAADHPHIKHRRGIVSRDGLLQPAPAPRFSRYEQAFSDPAPMPGADTREALRDWGVDPAALLDAVQSDA